MESPQQPRSHERSELPITVHGRLKVTDWVISTMPDREAAQACAQALVSAGFADDNVLVESPSSALQQLRTEEESERAGSRLVQLLHTVEDAVSGVGAALRTLYVAETTAGRWLAGAHDAQGNQIDRIRNVMIDHGGSNIRLFEPSGVRQLD